MESKRIEPDNLGLLVSGFKKGPPSVDNDIDSAFNYFNIKMAVFQYMIPEFS